MFIPNISAPFARIGRCGRSSHRACIHSISHPINQSINLTRWSRPTKHGNDFFKVSSLCKLCELSLGPSRRFGHVRKGSVWNIYNCNEKKKGSPIAEPKKRKGDDRIGTNKPRTNKMRRGGGQLHPKVPSRKACPLELTNGKTAKKKLIFTAPLLPPPLILAAHFPPRNPSPYPIVCPETRR